MKKSALSVIQMMIAIRRISKFAIKMPAENLHAPTFQTKKDANRIQAVAHYFKKYSLGYFTDPICIKMKDKSETCDKLDSTRCIPDFQCNFIYILTV
jgi:hypothetical protein